MLTKLSAADLARPAAASTMPGEMTGYKSGAETRRKILAALLEREPRTVRGLGEVAGIRPSAIHHHVRRMERDGLLRVERRTGRRGAEVYLTAAGRTAARTV